MTTPQEAVLRFCAPDGLKEAVVEARSPFLVEVRSSAGGRLLCCYAHHVMAVAALVWSPDSTRIATADFKHHVQVWDALTGQKIAAYRQISDRVTTLTFSPDDHSIAAGSADTAVYLLNAVTGMPLALFRGHDNAVRAAIFSPDRKHIASADREGTVHVWQIGARVPWATYTLPLQGELTSACLSWSPNGQYIAALCGTAAVHLLDVDACTWCGAWHIPSCSCKAIAWSADGLYLAMDLGDGNMHFFDTRTGREQR